MELLFVHLQKVGYRRKKHPNQLVVLRIGLILLYALYDMFWNDICKDLLCVFSTRFKLSSILFGLNFCLNSSIRNVTFING